MANINWASTTLGSGSENLTWAISWVLVEKTADCVSSGAYTAVSKSGHGSSAKSRFMWHRGSETGRSHTQWRQGPVDTSMSVSVDATVMDVTCWLVVNDI